MIVSCWIVVRKERGIKVVKFEEAQESLAGEKLPSGKRVRVRQYG